MKSVDVVSVMNSRRKLMLFFVFLLLILTNSSCKRNTKFEELDLNYRLEYLASVEHLKNIEIEIRTVVTIHIFNGLDFYEDYYEQSLKSKFAKRIKNFRTSFLIKHLRDYNNLISQYDEALKDVFQYYAEFEELGVEKSMASDGLILYDFMEIDEHSYFLAFRLLLEYYEKLLTNSATVVNKNAEGNVSDHGPLLNSKKRVISRIENDFRFQMTFINDILSEL